MTDRVHHSDHSNPPPAVVKPPLSDDKPLLPPQETYVIQIPKDQIYRIPPPENAQKIHKLANKKPRRSCCCQCFCWTISIAAILLILLSISAATFYFVFRPQSFKYSIDNLTVNGVNLTSPSAPISPRLAVGIRSENPNDKLSVYHIGRGSSVDVYYAGVRLCDGELPAFKQPANNVTVIQTALTGSGVVLARDVHSRLVREEKGGSVPLKLTAKMPVKIGVGSVKTWEMTVTVKCDVAVDRFSEKSKIVSEDCGYKVKLW